VVWGCNTIPQLQHSKEQIKLKNQGNKTLWFFFI
jgi:hypothetical protein